MIVEEVVRRFVSGGVGDQDHVLVVGLHTLHQQSHTLTGVGLPRVAVAAYTHEGGLPRHPLGGRVRVMLTGKSPL